MENQQTNQYVHFMITQALVESLKGLLGDSAKNYMAVVYKICLGVSTQQELEAVTHFLGKIYEAGYMKSVDNHRQALEQMGFQSVVVPNVNQNSDGTQMECSI
jgi:hypothetical protein